MLLAGMRTISWTGLSGQPGRSLRPLIVSYTVLPSSSKGLEGLSSRYQRMYSSSAMKASAVNPRQSLPWKNSTFSLRRSPRRRRCPESGPSSTWTSRSRPPRTPHPVRGPVVPAAVGCSAKPPPMAATAPASISETSALEGDVPENATTSPSWRSHGRAEVDLARVVGQRNSVTSVTSASPGRARRSRCRSRASSQAAG